VCQEGIISAFSQEYKEYNIRKGVKSSYAFKDAAGAIVMHIKK